MGKRDYSRFMGLKLSPRQMFAMDNPYDFLRDASQIAPGCQRDIGFFDTLLTIDIRPDFPEIFDGRTEWHASISLISSKVFKDFDPKFPAVILSAWGKKAWPLGLREVEGLLRGVGEGEGVWTGEPFSLHFRKPLTEKENEVLENLSNDKTGLIKV